MGQSRAIPLVVGVGEGAVEGMFERARTAPPKWLADARSQLPIERMSTLSYVNVQEIIERGVAAGGGDNGAKHYRCRRRRNGNVTSLISATGLDETGFVSRMLLKIDGKAQGVFALADAAPLSRDNLSIIPKHATISAALQLDSDKLLDTALQVMGKIEPRAAEEAATGIERFETMLDINLRGDLLKALGDTWCLYSDPDAGAILTGWTAAVEIRDREKLAATHEKLLALARGAFAGRERGAQIKQFSFAGTEIFYLVVPEDGMPFSPAWCLTEKHLVIGLFPQTIKAFLSRGDDFESIVENAQVASLFAGPGSGPISLTYVDTRQFFDPIYSFLQVMAQVAVGQLQQQGMDVDMAAFPSAAAIPQARPPQHRRRSPDRRGDRAHRPSVVARRQHRRLSADHGRLAAPRGAIGARRRRPPHQQHEQPQANRNRNAKPS